MNGERWTPDDAMVLSARRGALRGARLHPADRAWIVASLSADGVGAAEMASLLGCNERTIKQVRSDPVCQMAAHALKARREVVRAAHAAARAIRERNTERRAAEAENTRLRSQRAELIDQLHRARHRACPHCGHTAA